MGVKAHMNKYEILKETFGYTTFREGQEELINNILNGKDTLGIMPTGAGKSICFQVPALMFEGITLVISPLISLMKDQVGALKQAGIKAAYLNSSLSYTQYMKALQNARNNEYKIIYIAPERLMTDEFISFAKEVKISMITIDEAHCISQWGQDFRPSYVKIAQFIDTLPARPVVTAFTATATSKVRDDIIDKLNMASPYILTTGFDRKNLSFSVKKPKDKLATLMEFINENVSRYGIVYCLTRKTVDELYEYLVQKGYSVARYHAGLSDTERKTSQEDFVYDRSKIMVATNAFGMGIDKSNVSYVIHYNMPKNIESYYQEAGRAGRDGSEAQCILLYGGQDVILNQFLIDNSEKSEEFDEFSSNAVKEKERELLKAMTFYCHTNECLREYILNYFGERATNFCGNCSNCNTNFSEEDITLESQKIMSCIKRAGERFGISIIVDTLRGSKNQKVVRARLDKIPTYGAMTDVSVNKIRDIINYLVLEGYLQLTNGEYPVIKLTSKSMDVLLDKVKLKMKIVKEVEAKAKVNKVSLDNTDEKFDDDLFKKLRALRSRIASEQRVPAYIVFSDSALKDMCSKLPRNKDEFLLVSGVGQAKLEKYGEEFLELINS